MTAQRTWGRLWGSRARDWAASEEQQLPTYEEAIRLVGLEPGRRVLEVGCGTGVFLRRAADLGADVFGIDASEALLGLARERVPEADLRLGDMEALPFDDDSFDVVAGFNALFLPSTRSARCAQGGSRSRVRLSSCRYGAGTTGVTSRR